MRAGQIQIYLLIFLFRETKEAAVQSKFLFLNLPITCWFLMFCHLLLLDLFESKFVSKQFNELVNYDINFKRIFELTNSMC